MKWIAAAFAAALVTFTPAAMAQDAAAEAAAPAKANQPISHFFGIFEGSTKIV